MPENLHKKMEELKIRDPRYDDIVYIINEIAIIENLTKYINNVRFDSEMIAPDTLESGVDYNSYANELIVNVEVIRALFRPHGYNEVDSYIYNVMILFDEIFKGIERVKLERNLNKKINSEYLLIKDVEREYRENNKFLRSNPVKEITLGNYTLPYHNTEVINPTDRLVKVRAHYDSIRLLKLKYNNTMSFKNWFMDKVSNDCLTGYDENSYDKYPLIKYFSNFSTMEGKYYMSNFPWFNKEPMVTLSNVSQIYSLEDRLSYGMPIDLSEYKMVRCKKEL